MSTQTSAVIRKATPDDVLAIGHIARDAWEAAFLGVFLERDQLEYDLEREYAPEVLREQMTTTQTFVILEDGQNQTVGFAAHSLNPEKPEELFLNKLYLNPHVKGQGYGKQLLAHVCQQALEHGCQQITLLVNRKNPAVEFYQRMGFQIEANVDSQIGENFWRNDYRMMKLLKQKD